MQEKSKISKGAPKKDFFGRRGSLNRSEFKERLKKASHRVPGFTRMITRMERMGMESKLFTRKKYGSFIEKKDCRDVMKKLKREQYKTKDFRTRLEIKKKMSFLKNLTGL